MILIHNNIIDDAILQEKFVCNLSKCKGACCIEGESGAPLEFDELAELEEIFETIKPFLTPEGIESIEQNGHFVFDEIDRIFKTPLIDGGACAYINYDEQGISKCGIEHAWKAGAVEFRKPISCHLYPIRIEKSALFEKLNYEEWDICADACALGKELKVPVYQFLKEPIIRKYGADFYEKIDAYVKQLND